MASVRAEEFINYFDYNYPCTDAQPFDVHIDGMSDPFRPDHHIVRVGVQGKELTAETRPPLHLTFLVDVSGSMSSRDKLPLARQAMHLLIDTLQEGDTVALATYAGRGGTDSRTDIWYQQTRHSRRNRLPKIRWFNGHVFGN